ncbi:long-chain-fatty-acid--CoA ligase [Bacillus massiliglaciei]|uniref:long-chain-fatty-acid--CoA ligase n=1 Tax=Bacillus massiliglaciei TaxID=1816693 RepID=UPI000DA62AC3|nr:long-chain-fatty-acid--CoA ligase [Bacillus massiliglaciei]
MMKPLVLTDFLDRAASVYGEKKALIGEDKILTYRQLNERVNQLSYGLTDLGIKKGDKIAYLAPNSIEMLEGFYGVFQLGAVMVPLNIRLRPSDYLFILDHSESKVLFVDQEMYHLIEPIKDQLATVKHIIVHYKESQNIEIDYNKWLVQYPSTVFQRELIDENDIATLLYTSGTTGDPKGVMLTHRSNYLHALSAMHHIRVSDRDVLLHVLPMFHVNGWGSPFYYTLNGSAQICFRKTTPEIIFRALQEHQVSVLHMAPSVLNSILQYHERHKQVLDHEIRIVVAGSAPPPAFIRRVEEELGWEFIQVYGMTESAPLSLVSSIRSEYRHFSDREKYNMKAKAGHQMVGCEVKVVTDEGTEVPKDGKTVGEIIVRSHGVMLGYWKNEEATMRAIQNGWLHTGDVGTIDQYGNIDIVDRKKDIIISGGENISSIEVEGILYDHPDIMEAAVIAVPHEKWGETPHAFIVAKEGVLLSERDIIDFTRENLAHFKAVTGVSFVKELPKTASGKIQKVHLRNDYWEKSGKTGRFVN